MSDESEPGTDENYCDWRQSNCTLVAELRALNAELVSALEPFADALKDNYSHQVDDFPIIAGSNQMDVRFKWTLGDLRRAQAVLNKVRGGE